MRVAALGAAGRIGRVVRAGLVDRGHEVVALDTTATEGVVAVDARDTDALVPLIDGCDAVVHLASIAGETTFETALDTHLRVTHGVLEAMRRARVPRIVYASSNHAVGFTPRSERVSVDTRPRPDTFYGVGKAATEALCSLYVDRHGIQAACLRIGSFADRPTTRRHLSTWLSPADAVRLVDACLRAPEVTFAVVHGISANTRGWWDLEAGRALGYHPEDDAETYAREVLATPESDDDRFDERHVGGDFCRPDVPVEEDQMSDVLEDAREWLADDPDPTTRAELELLVERAAGGDQVAFADLADRFAGRLEFGTAGLRGALGAGPNRMNRAVVIRAAAGLAAYVRAHGGSSVVVGYDARHMSGEFARDTCAVLVGAGLRAHLLPRPLPTPVLAFAIRHLGVDAGVMVTASHNPPQDNGYKVYLGDGCQIVPPADAEITAEIDAVGSLSTVPLADDGWETLDDTLLDAYVSRIVSLVRPDGPRDVRIVYTPLHGVGGAVMRRVLEATGFPQPEAVEQQAYPDPDFPTTAFPNPEEPGAIDLAIALAKERDADLVIANDPDADRCAVAAPMPGGWRMLRGDEVGGLLATYLIARQPGLTGVFACSIVSSSLLGKIAGRYGLGYAETLTGFKWIGRIDDLRFGYEEALGYCVDPEAVRDKDGLSAAVLVAELAATLRAEGRGLAHALDDIARGYGLHATDQLSVRVDDLSLISDVLDRLRTTAPASLGGRAVEAVEDLSAGVGELPPTDGLRYRLAEGARVIVRPSGTEPKIKCYVEVVVEVAGDDVDTARATATEQLESIKTDLAAAAGL